MAALAAFAESPTGKFYAHVCDRWGLDPAAGFADDVLAVNLRAALVVARNREARNELAGEEQPDDIGAWLAANG